MRGSSPCTVLLDLMIPAMDDREFLERETRSDVRGEPVVLLTALDVEGDVEALAGRYRCGVVSKTGAASDLPRRITGRCC